VQLEVGRSVAAEALVVFRRNRSTRGGGMRCARETSKTTRCSFQLQRAQTIRPLPRSDRKPRRPTRAHSFWWARDEMHEGRQDCGRPLFNDMYNSEEDGDRQGKPTFTRQVVLLTSGLTSLPFWVPKYTDSMQRVPQVCGFAAQMTQITPE